jgi:hypothetical protein
MHCSTTERIGYLEKQHSNKRGMWATSPSQLYQLSISHLNMPVAQTRPTFVQSTADCTQHGDILIQPNLLRTSYNDPYD